MQNYKELVAKLRATKSVSKRQMLDAAADAIEQLMEDLRQSGRHEPCDYCSKNRTWVPYCAQDVICDVCQNSECPCHDCRDFSKWEWRGVPEEGRNETL